MSFAEFNGVTFKGWKRPSASASTDDFDIAFPSGGNSNGSAFGITDDDMSAGYKLMIQSATYPGGGTTDATPSALTLKRLTPGHRYLVHLWAHDGRSAATTGDRYVIGSPGRLAPPFRRQDSGVVVGCFLT